ncbi:putative S-adenosyl-L-methionine-dependent methyltransferase [Lyophyllum shimeji]|uniref:S-adenosyl-L-methionine-dependent methyltransferase n=1 Tax=Lyophyllum shimeji TaxID=47721 RepID=A0A9P3PER5_LYOSH|nr:putative S-adenosyl-L-methionine-dependent methyltransferase [Lyophyllum shimeji]
MSLARVAHFNTRRLTQCRGFAAVSSSNPPPRAGTVGPYQVFDRNVKRMQKDRAATRDGGVRSTTVDYVRDEVADRMIERFLDIKRTFSSVLDLGSGPGHFSKLLELNKTRKAVMIDSSEKTLNRDPDSEFEVEVERIHGDEENLLQIVEANSQEAIVSCLSLHWVNDLPGILVQIKEALKPDGLFLGAMFGGDTLFELRTSLQLAEVEREGGISPHVSPMTDTRDISNLLGRAGFTLLTVDIDEVKVAYPGMWELLEDLSDMGEANAVIGRRNFIHKDTLAAASAIYKEMHGNEDGSIPATFQVIYMIGWKPAPNQPKPLDRGTGKVNLKEIL